MKRFFFSPFSVFSLFCKVLQQRGSFCFWAFLFPFILTAQEPKRTFEPWKKTLAIEVGGYVVSTIGLSTIWYSDYTSFHFFNDGNEWRGMDKSGHFVTSYHITNFNKSVFLSQGLSPKKANLLSAGISTTYMLTIEVLDGFSKDYGASVWDLLANATGTAAAILNTPDSPLKFRYSYSPSEFAKHRPNLLGDNALSKALKDYNGQTYWASYFPLHKRDQWWGAFGVALGYGADGMIGGSNNPTIDKNKNPLPYFERTSQYYLSLDINWAHVFRKHEKIKKWCERLSFIKTPLAGLILNQKKVQLQLFTH